MRHALGLKGATREYGHNVLGGLPEAKRLRVVSPGTVKTCGTAITLDADHVFEDIAPRLWDLDGDGTPEIVVIRAHKSKGAQMAIYREAGNALKSVTASDYIGTRFRWLAPVGPADLDGDGITDLGFVDRPHLAKTLRLFRFEKDQLLEWGQVRGVSNHKIGWDFIAGGLRDCGEGPEIILADANWRRVVALSFPQGRLSTRQIAAYRGPSSLSLDCAP
ncbi:MAG: VCBS repeat-containing protein [Pseudomonadota bacterium]